MSNEEHDEAAQGKAAPRRSIVDVVRNIEAHEGWGEDESLPEIWQRYNEKFPDPPPRPLQEWTQEELDAAGERLLVFVRIPDDPDTLSEEERASLEQMTYFDVEDNPAYSDAARRIQRQMRKLTAALFVRNEAYNDFYKAIDHVRTTLRVRPQTAIPFVAPLGTIPDALLTALHEAYVPPDCRTGSMWDWEEFFTGCVGYDPPPDALIRYANMNTPYPATLYGWKGGKVTESPPMIAPAVGHENGRFVARPTPYTSREDERRTRSLIRAAQTGTRRKRDEDAEREGETPRAPLRRERDDLLAVQVSVWVDDMEWSHKQVAQELGVPLSPSTYYRKRDHGWDKEARSDVVNDLLRRGREIRGIHRR